MLQELRILLRALTLRRLWNYLLVLTSYYVSRTTGRLVHWGMPVSIGIEPTTACNLRCPQCPSGLRSFTRPTGRLLPGLFSQLIDEIAPDTTFLVMYFQGEPFLNPHFLDLVAEASQRKLYVQTSTNAHFLDDDTARRTVESGLSHLIVSLDGATQETYAQYRIEGEIDKVLAGVRNIVKWKRQLKSLTPLIDLQFIVFRHNQHEIDAVRKLGTELGVDRVSIKTAQVYDHDGPGAALIPTLPQYSRYRLNAEGQWQINSQLPNHCWKLWQGTELTWDGKVLPCCFDKDAQYVMGQFPTNSVKKIWRSDSYQAFRSQILKGRRNIDICRNCSEGLSAWEG